MCMVVNKELYLEDKVKWGVILSFNQANKNI